MKDLSSAGLSKRKAGLDSVLRKLAGKLHHHPCRACSLRYSCNCETPQQNGHCQSCRPVRKNERPTWDISTDPADCCFGNCQQVTDTDVIASYKLAGPGPWFQCRTCKRSHGRLPRRDAS